MPAHSPAYLLDVGKLACLDALLRSILGSPDRVVVVSNSTAALDIVQAHCQGNGWESCRLDGSTDANKRQVSTSCLFHKMLPAHALPSARLRGHHHTVLLLAYPDWANGTASTSPLNPGPHAGCCQHLQHHGPDEGRKVPVLSNNAASDFTLVLIASSCLHRSACCPRELVGLASTWWALIAWCCLTATGTQRMTCR